jgi:hypothetical protein
VQEGEIAVMTRGVVAQWLLKVVTMVTMLMPMLLLMMMMMLTMMDDSE